MHKRMSGARITRVAVVTLAALLASAAGFAQAPAAPAAAAAAPLDAVSVLARAQAAYFAGSAEELRRLAAATAPWARSTGAGEPYAYAYVQFRVLQLAIANKQKSEATKAGEACTTALDALTAREPRSAEAFALQSACYGYLAGLGGFGAISNGSRSGKSIEAAEKIDARNPRVILVSGFGLYFRPKFVGGDKDKGCALFRSAATAFEAAKPSTTIAWGAAEAHLWSGRCAADAGDAAGARREFEKALALAPDFVAAKRRLGR